jgi:Sugar (and other) transporter
MLKGGIISGSAVIKFFSVGDRMDINRFLGIFSVVLSLLAIVLTIIFYKESPLKLIETQNEVEALKIMLILRGEVEETSEITESLKEMRAMVADEKHLSTSIFQEGNIKPLIIVSLLKLAFVLTFNYSLKFIHFDAMKKSSIDYTFILNLVHTFTVVLALFTIDKGRRIHLTISGLGTSMILIMLGALRENVVAHSDFFVFVMFVAFEFLSALGFGLLAVIYSTEAFYTLKKPGSIAFTGILESSLQILFVIWVENSVHSNVFDVLFLLFSGIILGLISVFLFCKLPETSNNSIRVARYKFL